MWVPMSTEQYEKRFLKNYRRCHLMVRIRFFQNNHNTKLSYFKNVSKTYVFLHNNA